MPNRLRLSRITRLKVSAGFRLQSKRSFVRSEPFCETELHLKIRERSVVVYGSARVRGKLHFGNALLAIAMHRHRSEEHTSELQSRLHLVCRLLLEKNK